MSIPVSITGGKPSALPATVDNDNKLDAQSNNKVKDVDSPASSTAKARASLNSAIVQTSISVSLSSGNEPLALLLKSAINGINEELQPTLGKDAIQNAAATQDNSAEATAQRIVSLSTAFYEAYREQKGLEDNEATRKEFIGVIQGGFEKGFKEAQDVLDGLKVLGGDIAAGINKTRDLVLKGYQDFITPPAPPATEEGDATDKAKPKGRV
ncbi:DUF5610 domain-containing protein [Massilia sp. CF038]|uniref:DUF5610 domain-containing protein n=1 Tax=Massilia sp. CF038 TaxID=1881045 RepID=UPI00090F8CA1|nr:DUF5610 domain-containing protein [Massilia sp. CF038]SHH18490.1 hypothetical protein SAMN05428948_3201 [Massilia sp. CF038]